MNFYYDPILGLQYVDTRLYIIELIKIPENLNIDNLIKEWENYQNNLGFLPLSYDAVEHILNITQNYI